MISYLARTIAILIWFFFAGYALVAGGSVALQHFPITQTEVEKGEL